MLTGGCRKGTERRLRGRPGKKGDPGENTGESQRWYREKAPRHPTSSRVWQKNDFTKDVKESGGGEEKFEFENFVSGFLI